MVNHKRVERLYNEEGLWVRKRTRKRMKGVPRQVLQPPVRPNQQWAMDFVSDALSEGRVIRTLNVVDVFTREGLAIEVDFSLPSLRVVRVLEGLIQRRGLPEVVVSDNGPEFTSRVFRPVATWAGNHASPDQARQADAERDLRELQREVQGRMPERKLVQGPCGGPPDGPRMAR